MKTILVTNYRLKIFNTPITEFHKSVILNYDEKKNELVINDCLFIHVFENVPILRKIKENKIWFDSNIYHLNPIN